MAEAWRWRMVLGASLGALLMALSLWMAESWGVSKSSINVCFLVLSIAGYATIGLVCRTTLSDEYYVAGRRIRAPFNGMATAADWMSAATFMGLTGLLISDGFVGDGERAGGLAYVLGWTGGFCLLGILFAGKIQQSGATTIPELLGQRMDSSAVRWLAAAGAILCSGVYLVAQIYAIGLVASMLSGMNFELGVFLALGGVLLCSFLGGMRAVTWTQVLQCVVIVSTMVTLAVAVSWHVHGSPLPSWGASLGLQGMAQRVRDIQADPAEAQSKAIMLEKLAELDRKIAAPEQARFAERQLLGAKIAELKQQNSPVRDIQRLEANPVWHDNDSQRLVQAWQRERSQIQHELQRAIGFERGTAQDSQNGLLNTLCLVLCFMMGTASLPHVLMRSLTTPTARQAQKSIVWTLVWVVIVYLCASSLAVMIKQVVLTDLVGSAMNALPEWAQQLRLRKPALLTLNDHNGDGLVQWADVRLATDYLVLAVPEILGISAVFTGLIAAGALAAALSTADGLLLTISNALAHDMYFQTLAPKATPIRRVMLSKILLMLVALVAAWIATYRPVDILFWVSCAFSLAASCFFPVLLLSLYWPGFTRAGAIAAMVCGTVLALWYIGAHSLAAMGLGSLDGLWWGVAPVSAGVFGVPTGLVAGIVASKIWPAARAAPTPAAS